MSKNEKKKHTLNKTRVVQVDVMRLPAKAERQVLLYTSQRPRRSFWTGTNPEVRKPTQGVYTEEHFGGGTQSTRVKKQKHRLNMCGFHCQLLPQASKNQLFLRSLPDFFCFPKGFKQPKW